MGTMLLIAGIIATISGIIGGIDYDKEYKETQADLEDQKKDLGEQYAQNVKNIDDKYKAERDKDFKNASKLEENADFQDKVLNTQEKEASDTFNLGVDRIQTEQETNLFSWNNALASIGVNTGSELAAVANNGTRAGSSLAQAVKLESAVNTSALELEMKNTDRQHKWELQNLFSQNKAAGNNIWQGRVGADQNRYEATDLRNSWNQGGNNWTLWKDQKDSLTLDYTQKKDFIDKSYERNKKNYGWGLFSSIMNAGNKGFETGLRLYNTFDNASGGKK